MWIPARALAHSSVHALRSGRIGARSVDLEARRSATDVGEACRDIARARRAPAVGSTRHKRSRPAGLAGSFQGSVPRSVDSGRRREKCAGAETDALGDLGRAHGAGPAGGAGKRGRVGGAGGIGPGLGDQAGLGGSGRGWGDRAGLGGSGRAGGIGPGWRVLAVQTAGAGVGGASRSPASAVGAVGAGPSKPAALTVCRASDPATYQKRGSGPAGTSVAPACVSRPHNGSNSSGVDATISRPGNASTRAPASWQTRAPAARSQGLSPHS